MLCEPARYLMLTNSLSSLRVSVRSEDMRENSVLADYEIKLWALRTILKFLSTPVAEDPLDRSEDDLATRLVIKSLIDPCPYSLTQRSINELALFKPLSNEVLDAYIHLLVTKRCHSDMLREDEKLFHFFDSIFYCQLSSLKNSNRDNLILKLNSFFDKHYISTKAMTKKNSVFLFLVPSQTAASETVLVLGQPAEQRFVVYDPLEGRDPNTFKKQVDVLRPFLAAYIDEFEHGQEDESIDSQDRLADSVEDWRIHNGLCTRVS